MGLGKREIVPAVRQEVAGLEQGDLCTAESSCWSLDAGTIWMENTFESIPSLSFQDQDAGSDYFQFSLCLAAIISV